MSTRVTISEAIRYTPADTGYREDYPINMAMEALDGVLPKGWTMKEGEADLSGHTVEALLLRPDESEFGPEPVAAFLVTIDDNDIDDLDNTLVSIEASVHGPHPRAWMYDNHAAPKGTLQQIEAMLEQEMAKMQPIIDQALELWEKAEREEFAKMMD